MRLRDGKRTVKAELLQLGMRITDGAETGTVATRPRRFNRTEGVNFLVQMDDGRGVSGVSDFFRKPNMGCRVREWVDGGRWRQRAARRPAHGTEGAVLGHEALHDIEHGLGESDVDDLIAPMVQELDAKGLLVNDQGARIIRVAREGDKRELPPLLVVSSEGSAMYGTTDLATIVQRRDDLAAALGREPPVGRERRQQEVAARGCERRRELRAVA